MLKRSCFPLQAVTRSSRLSLCTLPHNAEPINYEGFGFNIIKQAPAGGSVNSSSHGSHVAGHNRARRCTITTPHGEIQTPAFVFCATKATLKAMTPDMLKAEDTSVILSNTYHLMLQPGADVVQKLGGLQKMTGWGGPMLTDSGGYQIFSMGHGSVSNEVKGKRNATSQGWVETLIKINEGGATFRSYINGQVHTLTPESSMQVQQKLGADLVVVLDECTPFHVDKAYTAASMRRSHRWALRSLREFRRLGCSGGTARVVSGTASDASLPRPPLQALYGIIQGGVYEDLRRESAAFINSYPFFGTAIGGSLGADKSAMNTVLSFTRPLVRDDRPVHLLGIGGLKDIFHGVRLGIDTFDCVHPTRLGRHGGALVKAAHWERLREEVAARDRQEQEASHLQSQRLDGVAEDADSDTEVEVTRKKLTHKERKREKWNRKLLKQKNIQRQNELIVREHINVSKPMMEGDPRPLDPDCECYTCRTFSRGYLHHLFKSKEILGQVLLTTHNVHFMNKMMSDIRMGIEADCLDDVERKYIDPMLGTAVDLQQ